jgi:hypothetical protein
MVRHKAFHSSGVSLRLMRSKKEGSMTKINQADFAENTATKIERPKTRAQKLAEWRHAHYSEYKKACDDAQCTCTPTRAQMLIMNQYDSPPID